MVYCRYTNTRYTKILKIVKLWFILFYSIFLKCLKLYEIADTNIFYILINLCDTR